MFDEPRSTKRLCLATISLQAFVIAIALVLIPGLGSVVRTGILQLFLPGQNLPIISRVLLDSPETFLRGVCLAVAGGATYWCVGYLLVRRSNTPQQSLGRVLLLTSIVFAVFVIWLIFFLLAANLPFIVIRSRGLPPEPEEVVKHRQFTDALWTGITITYLVLLAWLAVRFGKPRKGGE